MHGDNAGVVGKGSIDASGKTGGGTILLGGDFQGKNSNIQNAQKTFVSPDAKLIAEATDAGNGGKVIVWADDITRYYGNISAKGGANGGNGGFVEVSGKQVLDFIGGVDVSAAQGRGGLVLLDPQDILLNTSTQPSPPNNANGTPDVVRRRTGGRDHDHSDCRYYRLLGIIFAGNPRYHGGQRDYYGGEQ